MLSAASAKNMRCWVTWVSEESQLTILQLKQQQDSNHLRIICNHPRPNALEWVWRISSPLLLFSRSVMSNSLWPHGLQHARLPCPSLSPRVCSDSCSLSSWCYLTISSSTTLFSFCLQSLPASGPFPMSQFFASGGQSIGVSASASVLQWICRVDFL